MIILLSLTIITALGFWATSRLMDTVEWYEFLTIPVGVISIISGFALFTFIIFLPIDRAECYAKMEQIKVIQSTFNKARKSPDNVERFSRLDEIIDVNKWIVSKQYYNRTYFDIWIPDEVMTLQPIE